MKVFRKEKLNPALYLLPYSYHIIIYIIYMFISKHVAQHVYICVYLTSSLQHFVQVLLFSAAVSTVAFGTIKSAGIKRTGYESRMALHTRRIS